MNWFRENKFLGIFLVVLVIGAAGLGYLLYSAYGSYSDVTDQYNQQAAELQRLQALTPYPDHDNLAKYKAEYDSLVNATHDLAENLGQMVLPVEDVTPSAFQDRLRDTVSTLTAKAERTGVKLPDHFSMDMERYQSEPPSAAAAGPLARQLAALNIAMNILVDEHVDSVSTLQRAALPQETGVAHPAVGLVDKVPFLVRFTANQPAFQKVLNDFAAAGKQFFITRTLTVEDTDARQAPKGGEVSAPAAGTGQPGAAEAAASPGPAGGAEASRPGYLKFIVGTEKLNVVMRIDIAAFNPPEKSTRKGATPPR